MNNFIAFLEVTGAILAGLGLAMSLEWLTLNGLLRLMPSGSHAKFHRATRDESTVGPNPFSPR